MKFPQFFAKFPQKFPKSRKQLEKPPKLTFYGFLSAILAIYSLRGLKKTRIKILKIKFLANLF